METAQAAKTVLSSATTVTMIADREADLYPFWASIPEANIHMLGQIFHNRRLPGGGSLYTASATWPVLGRRTIAIRERPDRPARVAELEVRAGTVTIPRPQEPRTSTLPKQVTLTLLEVSEPAPPGPPSSPCNSPRPATARTVWTAPSSSRPPNSTLSKPSIDPTQDQARPGPTHIQAAACHGPLGSSRTSAAGMALGPKPPNRQAPSPSSTASTFSKP